jgi:two-component system sensor histidine kinase UhpB
MVVRSVVLETTSSRMFRFRHRDGSWRVVETQVVVVEYEGATALQMTFKDITVAKAAEDELNATHRKMRNLAVHLLHAREEERRKIAQEVHDELGQTLAAIKMDLHWLDKRLRGSSPAADRKLKGMIDLGEQMIGIVQRISSQLRPRMLDDLGLAPALEWLAADFTRRTKIVCTVETEFPSGLLGGNSATTLYRVVQEALSNVSRHSHARRAAVRLCVSGDAIMLSIEDDGIGITPAQATAPESYGLVGIHERVEELGGNLSISGEKGSGTILRARIPLPREGGLA